MYSIAMKSYIVAWVLLTVLVLSSLYYLIYQGRKNDLPNNSLMGALGISGTPPPSLVLGPFKGTLPCADCSGLETELTLTKDGPYSDQGSYTLMQKYIGKSDQPLQSSGSWSMGQGTNKDPNAQVYVLDPEKPEEKQYFLRVNDSEVKMLDSNGNQIDSPFNLTLKKQ